MYSLFEVCKILSISSPSGNTNVKITLSTYTGNKDFSILALVCDNGYVLFRHLSNDSNAPLLKQLCWFNNPEKEIKALCFDSTGLWLLIVTQDATIYILPMSLVIGNIFKSHVQWKLDHLTEIKLSGQRANMTSVQWWQTHQGEQIAIIGSELGEISFINLLNKKEVGGTYITNGILALNILYDESHDTTYLLITGSNQQQWRLLLEEKKTNYYWPFNSENDIQYNSVKGISIPEGMSLTGEANGDQRPHRLSKFESGTFLTPQCEDGRNLVSAYNSSSCLLQVLEGDLDQMHLFSYKVPADCENIVMSDKLIFAILKNKYTSGQNILKIISRKFSEISAENSKKKDNQNAEFQQFVFDNEIMAMYKSFGQYSRLKIEKSVLKYSESATKRLDSLVNKTGIPDGCILVQEDCVWECRLKMPPEIMFLCLTNTPSELPLAEKMGMILGLDLHKLYEIAADTQLSSGQFAQAVHLYQLSKCPQLKRVAHFMGYGFLSELIAYTQVLFSTKSIEVVSADKCHFANIALHCFTHQVKNKDQDRNVICTAFKKFLKENSHYDEEVAAKLLSEQALCEMIYYFAKVRGQSGLMAEMLMSSDGIKNTVDESTYQALLASHYEKCLHQSNDEFYIKCVTSFHLLQYLASNPIFLNQHLQHIIKLLPKLNVESLRRVAALYDPSLDMTNLTFRNLMTSKRDKRYWSMSSLLSISCEMQDDKKEEMPTVEDIIKFFIFVLLMICKKMSFTNFSTDFMHEDNISKSINSTWNESENVDNEFLSCCYSPLSCGQAHVAYIHSGILYTWGKSSFGRLGNKEIGTEYRMPQPLLIFLQLQLNVISVSCGALHTIALTECGLFGWGSSRYGQLGIGEVQQTVQPIAIKGLAKEKVVQIECGQYHTVALTSDGRVFTWGWGIHGQLGHGNAEDINFPKVVNSLKNIKIISVGAGQGHTVVLSKNGNVYSFGCGMFGQLGNGSTVKQCYPQPVYIPERITQIASGYFHVLAISKGNAIYTWGCNPQTLKLQAQNNRRARHHNSMQLNPNLRSNQMANSAIKNISSKNSQLNEGLPQNHLVPKLFSLPSSNKICQMSCGSHHSVIVTTNGELFIWGRNSEGQIGNGTRKEQKNPSLVLSLKGRKIVYCSCGSDFTIAVDSTGKLFGWGQNDGGQIGQKLSSEYATKSNSGSSSGRVITIRTNRRMITITQPCHQSILRPIEILIPYLEVNSKFLDSGSFENEYNFVKLLSHRLKSNITQNLPELQKLDYISYGPFALHAALEAFHHQCDSNLLMNHCINFRNYQAAAKICSLNGSFDKALDYQLKALVSSDFDQQIIFHVADFYSKRLDAENVDLNKKFLICIIDFCIGHNISSYLLEKFLKSHCRLFSYPLCLIFFGNSKAHQEFLVSLPVHFFLEVVSVMLSEIQQGSHLSDLLNEMSVLSNTAKVLNTISEDNYTVWDDSIPQERLWIDILHNLQSGMHIQSSINLSGNDVDLLAKYFHSEKLQSQTFHTSSKNLIISNGNKVIVFSCGHHYVYSSFQNTAMKLFKDFSYGVPYAFSHTTNLLLSEYQEDTIFAACPKCVVSELKNVSI